MTDLVQEEAKMEMVGFVVSPPSATDVVLRVVEAADRKESLTLSPAECRVLAVLIS